MSNVLDAALRLADVDEPTDEELDAIERLDAEEVGHG